MHGSPSFASHKLILVVPVDFGFDGVLQLKLLEGARTGNKCFEGLELQITVPGVQTCQNMSPQFCAVWFLSCASAAVSRSSAQFCAVLRSFAQFCAVLRSSAGRQAPHAQFYPVLRHTSRSKTAQNCTRLQACSFAEFRRPAARMTAGVEVRSASNPVCLIF